MPQIKLLLEFDGSDFHGWQYQPGQRTVQGTVQEALSTMVKAPLCARTSSRTDAGVHARAMPVTFRTEQRIPLRGWMHGLNSLLPSDVTVHSVEEVPDDFDVRRSGTGKTYIYRIFNAPYPSALEARYAWWQSKPLDIAAMQQAAEALLGEHDFSAFRAAHCDSKSVLRFMESIVVEHQPRYVVEIAISANAFLRNMARIIAGTLVEVGMGRRTRDDVAAGLASRDRSRTGVTAPPQGLFLWEVRYR